MLELNKVHIGDCMELIRQLPDKSINSVITSPPYWMCRNYNWAGQWGLEPTFQAYLEHLWELMGEIYRVLKDDGTVWVNLGDTYSTTSGNIKQGNLGTNKIKYTGRIEHYKKPENLSKCLLLIPHRFAIGCIDRGFILRNDIVWAKRNGMPESVTDRFSKKHEYFFFLVKQGKYYFDLDGIRDQHKQVSIERNARGVSENNKLIDGADGQTPHNLSKQRPHTTILPKDQSEMFGSPRARQHREGYEDNVDNLNPLGKNPGDVSDFWDIPTRPSKDKHFASYNTKLIDKPIISGCPIGGIILDPFSGTATTGCRAIDLGRKFIGFEGSEEYASLSNKKLEHYRISQQLF